LRPVKISDETMLKDFFYSLSDKSLYQRFLTIRRHMPHEELQKQFVVIDYTKEMIILAVKKYLGHEVITGRSPVLYQWKRSFSGGFDRGPRMIFKKWESASSCSPTWFM